MDSLFRRKDAFIQVLSIPAEAGIQVSHRFEWGPILKNWSREHHQPCDQHLVYPLLPGRFFHKEKFTQYVNLLAIFTFPGDCLFENKFYNSLKKRTK